MNIYSRSFIILIEKNIINFTCYFIQAQRNENKIDCRKQTYYHNRRLSPRIKKYKVQYTSD